MNEIRYQENKITKITSSALMLSVIFVLGFFLRFIKFNSFLSFNFSFVIIYITYRYISKKGAFLIAFLNAIISPAINAQGYEPGIMLGHFILLLSIILFVLFLDLFQFIIPFKKLIFNIFQLLLATIAASIIITLLNVYIFTAIYFKIYHTINSFSYTEIIKKWNIFRGLFFNMNSYFLGAGITYFTFNIINISVNSILILLLQNPVKKIFSFKF
ncbi:MPN527 family putative ECF transporter permease subunit [Mycoplasma phocimorsus]|uniref:Uncharacterized protein n=1 Tax=Mycoplasma phocimorsus TaxID=3045839 RepID=A0AAJ1PUB7_9MOLU|nr:hypothetical protein [Mycoplasma phocimorsus]MDJ1645995.1 hypothetical protein [Mycoplasma phocimorsus]MDJ1646275.1 hypothetical protein [Mycoplasma phocimorsus]MDJ1646879.1 hypothetical protein [Mycoplasma phocimorsus]MDJ1647846.1 hypothetical protein [Mycoplasma phocimorsus]MDJ1648453.1 hypothetical protein [Mycoplasma phocimorsus]